jgi:holo-[acyl-carrier protein] synthase
MILGVGSDLVDIRRIDEIIKRYGDRFLDRIFTETERRRCDRRANRAEGYARRFAAKEAAAKALGTGFRLGIYWRDLGIVNQPTGQPGLALTGGALRRLQAMVPAGMTARIDVSLTDEPPLAQAIVIISAVPAAGG